MICQGALRRASESPVCHGGAEIPLPPISPLLLHIGREGCCQKTLLTDSFSPCSLGHSHANLKTGTHFCSQTKRQMQTQHLSKTVVVLPVCGQVCRQVCGLSLRERRKQSGAGRYLERGLVCIPCPVGWTAIATGINSEHNNRSWNSQTIWQPVGAFQRTSCGPPTHVSLDSQRRGRVHHAGNTAPKVRRLQIKLEVPLGALSLC